ncbi:MAG: YdcF family protein [Bacteroidetes bacterium]|nr:YdcF family protein [Bacteroidota bacterium]MBS1541536.1 YdcF family protein [Bacteroidota bacterium]
MKWWPALWRVLIVFCLSALVLVAFANWWVIASTRDKVLTDMRSFPKRQVALVLGTSSKLKNGTSNPFFANRIKAAAELYHQGKVSHFILSGDNRTRYYNEPLEMKKALIKLQVPDSAITLDLAGLRTLDSIVRSKEIFGQDQITIITQSFHSYRALFISRYYHIDAVALVAREPENEIPFQVYVREYLARTKAVLDLYVLSTAPRHLGEKEHLPL